MPTLKIRNIHDAYKIIDRYGLASLPDQSGDGVDGWTWSDFAAWLFLRTNAVATEDLAGYIDKFKDDFDTRDTERRTFSEQVQQDADDTMEGVTGYERHAHELCWIVRELSATREGRTALGHVARAATSKNFMDYLSTIPCEENARIGGVFEAVNRLKIAPVLGIGYTRGADSDTDLFMANDIQRLGETLADEALWRDDEDFGWPTEVYALADCAREWEKEVMTPRWRKSIDPL
jgi:hypothetical protein